MNKAKHGNNWEKNWTFFFPEDVCLSVDGEGGLYVSVGLDGGRGRRRWRGEEQVEWGGGGGEGRRGKGECRLWGGEGGVRIAGLWLGPPVPRVSAGTSRRSAGWRMLERRVWISPSGVSLPLSLRLPLNPKWRAVSAASGRFGAVTLPLVGCLVGEFRRGRREGIASFSLK